MTAPTRCGHRSRIGTRCYRPAGHTGPHIAGFTEKENPMEHCDFCETTVESVSTGGGVGICADCRGEAEVSR